MAVLQLKALGIDNVLRFNFPSPPPARNLHSALGLLYALGAINSEGQLTEPLGIKMAEFPLSPLYSKALLTSGKWPVSKNEYSARSKQLNHLILTVILIFALSNMN
jgi:ATP-dependent RNA helicase DDX35